MNLDQRETFNHFLKKLDIMMIKFRKEVLEEFELTYETMVSEGELDEKPDR